MEEKKFDKLMKDAFAWMEAQRGEDKDLKGEVKAEGCPSEETISDYLASRLPAAEKNTAEEHFSHCSECRRLLVTLVKVGDEGKESLKEILAISLAWIKDRLILLETNADPLPFQNNPVPVLARGSSSQPETCSLSSFSKTIRNYRVTAHVEGDEGICELHLEVSPPAGQRLGSRIKVDLVQADRVFRSYPLEEGTVLIGGISPGEYEIRVREGENLIAPLLLNIRQGLRKD
jgi:hypothetical protein